MRHLAITRGGLKTWAKNQIIALPAHEAFAPALRFLQDGESFDDGAVTGRDSSEYPPPKDPGAVEAPGRVADDPVSFSYLSIIMDNNGGYARLVGVPPNMKAIGLWVVMSNVRRWADVPSLPSWKYGVAGRGCHVRSN